MDKENIIKEENIGRMLKTLSSKDFLGLGVQDIAYIRSISIDGKSAYAIHAADGTHLSVADDKIAALGLIRKNDMNVVTVH